LVAIANGDQQLTGFHMDITSDKKQIATDDSDALATMTEVNASKEIALCENVID